MIGINYFKLTFFLDQQKRKQRVAVYETETTVQNRRHEEDIYLELQSLQFKEKTQGPHHESKQL